MLLFIKKLTSQRLQRFPIESGPQSLTPSRQHLALGVSRHSGKD